MDVLNVRAARAIWLVDARDLNPRGLDILPALTGIRDRYRFQSYPRTIEDADESSAKGIAFAAGKLVFEEKSYALVKATMFSDGLVVETALSTDLSEAFLADVLEFLSSKYGLTYNPDMIHRRMYISELIVHSRKDLGRLFAPLAKTIEKLNLLTGKEFHPHGFGLSEDLGKLRPTAFRFEREADKLFSQGRYFSSAPLKTSQHIELLEEMESLF